MSLTNLLKRYPKIKRDIKARNLNKTDEVIGLANLFGYDYFDGDRETGYGGYKYDGRWVPVANDIINHFNLKKGQKVLDVGCAKGFLVYDLKYNQNEINSYGLDISSYAIKNCKEEIKENLIIGNAKQLPFEDNSFDAVISINTLHNLERDAVIMSLKEIERVSRGKSYVQVDSYSNEEEKIAFMEWVLTAKYHDYPKEWVKIFKDAGYTGDYYWTIAE